MINQENKTITEVICDNLPPLKDKYAYVVRLETDILGDPFLGVEIWRVPKSKHSLFFKTIYDPDKWTFKQIATEIREKVPDCVSLWITDWLEKSGVNKLLKDEGDDDDNER